MSTLRIGVIGGGVMGIQHLEFIAGEPALTLAGLADPSPAAGRVAERFNTQYYAEPQALLARGRPDAVVVATPNQLHFDHAMLAVAAGIPVLVEKPVTTDLASALRLAEAAERGGVPVLVGHHRRHNPRIAAVRDCLRRGELGELVAVNGLCLLHKPDSYYEVPWRREAGAGPVLVNLVHEIDLLRHLCGDIVEVQGLGSRERRGFANEDTAAIGLRFANGALGSFVVSDTAACPWSWELSSGESRQFPQHNASSCFISGTRGALSIPDLTLWQYRNPELEPGWASPMDGRRLAFSVDGAYRRQLAHFCALIRGEETEPLVSVRDAAGTLAVCNAIRQALASGRPERVELT
ncbi:Gfo/Idh/MocA family protein [Zobellella iuensis]|uniref:Gfo/Idh/MocA family oxidoreductase n=1 Tax=Zobellella iuensis TaxID=2803811 RepID=A0ABS1QN29_9GAMM|nr:Gfo/Idh/MocA family oxidoreductase [Zobellella iuensis]MBL1375886.1 Gfo/Idh/MocA family oxidoreductase [Zobellella iuensis]